MVQMPSRKLVVLAALAAASTLTAARAQTPARAPQWPLTLQDAAQAKGLPLNQAPNAAAPASAGPATASPGQQTVPAQPVPEPAPAEVGWTESEIATARARCNAIIARYDATAIAMEPIREGDCGSPHPVQLTRIGAVTMSQPAIVNCEVIAALGDWLKVDVQPAAKQLLGARVTGIEVLSSYSCRNAYGRKRSRMSEHGRANAIDIKSFHFEKQQIVDLMADWGMTERDIKARIAAAEAAAKAQAAAKAKAEAEAQALAQAKQRSRTQGGAVADTGANDRRHGLAPSADGLSALRGMVPEIVKPDDDRSSSSLSLGQPSRLGGPKAKAETQTPTQTQAAAPPASTHQPVAPSIAPNARQLFLRGIHAAACRRFGTVLGPEANEAHRNHFHLDMADRGGRGSFCE